MLVAPPASPLQRCRADGRRDERAPHGGAQRAKLAGASYATRGSRGIATIRSSRASSRSSTSWIRIQWAAAFARSSTARGVSRRREPHEGRRGGAAREAAAIAKANRVARDRAVQLAPSPSYPDATWMTPHSKDPIDVPVEEKASLLLKANAEAMKVPGVKFVFSGLFFRKQERNYANSDGSVIAQTVAAELAAHADHGDRTGHVGFPESRERRRAGWPRVRVRH
jgi:hypothetical protein